MKSLIRNLLLAFVFLSIGFALVRQYAVRRNPAPVAAAWVPAGPAEGAVVYYLHAANRCATCNRIEKLAHDLVAREFDQDLKGGRLEWRTACYQDNDAMAKHYGVASSTLLVARYQGGREIAYQRLEDVWKLHTNPPAFEAYVSGAVRSALEGRTP